MSPPRSVWKNSTLAPHQQMLRLAVAAERQHVRVLEQKQLVGNLARLAAPLQLALQLPRPGVGNAAELVDFETTH
jgi:hypothetical protein